MRVQEFKDNVRLTCTREEFIQLRMALCDRRAFLCKSITSGDEDNELNLAFRRFKDVCDNVYENMIQL